MCCRKVCHCQICLKAINAEVETITKNDACVDVHGSHPLERTAVLPSGISLKVKRNIQGEITRYNALLVVRGDFQSDVDDYTSLFAPVVFVELVRLMLGICVAKSYRTDHLHINGLFLLLICRKATTFGYYTILKAFQHLMDHSSN